jgi:hypothetical protein
MEEAADLAISRADAPAIIADKSAQDTAQRPALGQHERNAAFPWVEAGGFEPAEQVFGDGR